MKGQDYGIGSGKPTKGDQGVQREKALIGKITAGAFE